MRLKKAFSFIAVMNFFALIIVYQQTEIIKFGYKNKQKEDLLTKLTDNRSYLKYELENCKSMKNINNKLFGKLDKYQMPTEMQVVLINSSTATLKPNQIVKAAEKERSILSRAFFWLGREAEAQSSE